ncbi:MAG: YdeI/OmpD-associated family protein, partial [Acidimicrobiales bacterium]
MPEAYEQLIIRSRSEWRAWLADNHDRSPGIWVVTYKKAGDGPHVPYAEVVEEALCFGWIDGRGRRLDDQRTRLLVTPRRPASGWSRVNKERIARLLAAGAMTPAGIVVVEAAKASGTWVAFDDIENLVEPDDLRRALDADPVARGNWEGFPPSARKAILVWVTSAKRPDTRARRVRETVEEAAAGRRANQAPG